MSSAPHQPGNNNDDQAYEDILSIKVNDQNRAQVENLRLRVVQQLNDLFDRHPILPDGNTIPGPMRDTGSTTSLKIEDHANFNNLKEILRYLLKQRLDLGNSTLNQEAMETRVAILRVLGSEFATYTDALHQAANQQAQQQTTNQQVQQQTQNQANTSQAQTNTTPEAQAAAEPPKGRWQRFKEGWDKKMDAFTEGTSGGFLDNFDIFSAKFWARWSRPKK